MKHGYRGRKIDWNVMFVVFMFALLALMYATCQCMIVDCTIENGTQLYRFHWTAWIGLAVMVASFAGCAEYLRRKTRDFLGATLLYCCIPVWIFITLGIAFERIEIDSDSISYFREPPFRNLNGRYAWSEIKEARKNRQKHQDPLWRTYSDRIGYELTLNNGQIIELAVCDTLTSASEEIDRKLKSNTIPITTIDL